MDKQKTYTTHNPRHHKVIHRARGNAIYEAYISSGRRLQPLSNVKLFFLSLLAGAFMCLASYLSVLFCLDQNSTGVCSLLMSFAFSLGMLFVFFTQSALMTDANVFIPQNFYQLSMLQSCLRLFRFWGIAFLGNLLGALLFALFVYLSQATTDAHRQVLINVSAIKLAHPGSLYYRSMIELIFSGMLANWIIAQSNYFIMTSRNLTNRAILLFLTFAAIAVSNFQYFPLNLGYFSLNLFLAKSINFSDAIFFNLIPVILGNILGAGFLATGTMLLLSKKNTDKR